MQLTEGLTNSKKAVLGWPECIYIRTYIMQSCALILYFNPLYAMNFVCVHPSSPVSQHESIRLGRMAAIHGP
jgi:hypothetical protein